jgi:hypothetical protein
MPLEPSDEDSTVTIHKDEAVSLNKKIDKILEKVIIIETRYAVQETRLAMVERLVYGGVGLALTSVVVGILALVVVRK